MDARLRAVKAELELLRLRKAGLAPEKKLVTASIGALAMSELVAAFCVLSVSIAWAVYCVDWKEVDRIKDKAVHDVTSRIQNGGKANNSTDTTTNTTDAAQTSNTSSANLKPA